MFKTKRSPYFLLIFILHHYKQNYIEQIKVYLTRVLTPSKIFKKPKILRFHSNTPKICRKGYAPMGLWIKCCWLIIVLHLILKVLHQYKFLCKRKSKLIFIERIAGSLAYVVFLLQPLEKVICLIPMKGEGTH